MSRAAVDGRRLRKTLQHLNVAGVNITANVGRPPSTVAVVSLTKDPRALALGPQLAVFAASLGIPTALVIGPLPGSGGDHRPQGGVRRLAGEHRSLQVAVLGKDGPEIPSGTELTVVVAVVDGKNPKPIDTLQATATLLGVSAGGATAEQLARMAMSAPRKAARSPAYLSPTPTGPTGRRAGSRNCYGRRSGCRHGSPHDHGGTAVNEVGGNHKQRNHTPVETLSPDDVRERLWVYEDFTVAEEHPTFNVAGAFASLGFIGAAVRRSLRFLLMPGRPSAWWRVWASSSCTRPPTRPASPYWSRTTPRLTRSRAMLTEVVMVESHSVAAGTVKALGLPQSSAASRPPTPQRWSPTRSSRLRQRAYQHRRGRPRQ